MYKTFILRACIRVTGNVCWCLLSLVQYNTHSRIGGNIILINQYHIFNFDYIPVLYKRHYSINKLYKRSKTTFSCLIHSANFRKLFNFKDKYAWRGIFQMFRTYVYFKLRDGGIFQLFLDNVYSKCMKI